MEWAWQFKVSPQWCVVTLSEEPFVSGVNKHWNLSAFPFPEFLPALVAWKKKILMSKGSAKVIHCQHIVRYCDRAECLVFSFNRRGNSSNLLSLRKSKNMYLRFLNQTIKSSKSFGNFEPADTRPYWHGNADSITQDMILCDFASSLIP